MIWQVIGAFIAIVSFSIILEVPRKYLLFAGGIAALGWFVYLITNDRTGSIYIANFISAIIISFGAQIMARILKTPVTMFNIPGIMPLVPGAGMYQIVYHIIYSNNDLVNFYLIQTLQIAGLIAIAIFLVDSIFRLFVIKTSTIRNDNV